MPKRKTETAAEAYTEITPDAEAMESLQSLDSSESLYSSYSPENSYDGQNPEGDLMDYENMISDGIGIVPDEDSAAFEDGIADDGGKLQDGNDDAAGNVLVEAFADGDFEYDNHNDITFAGSGAPDTGIIDVDKEIVGHTTAAEGSEGAEPLEILDWTGKSLKTVPASKGPGPARRERRREQSPASVLTLEAGGEVETQRDKENAIWHEIKNSRVSGTHLTGFLGKVERLENGGLIAVVDYKGQRVLIPLREMMIDLNRPAGQSDDEYNERAARVLNRMMGAEIDFVVRGITETAENRAAAASRRAAMLRLRRRYYLTNSTSGKPMVYPGRIVEARIIAVSQMAVRAEIFGAETSIRSRELSWGYIGDARDKFYVGDSTQVRVTAVEGTTPEDIQVKADIKSLTEDNTREKLMALKPQTNCMGKVTDVRQGVIFISLVDGVRAISHKCFDHRKPGKGDDVLFVCTRTSEENGAAIGIVSRIVKRNI